MRTIRLGLVGAGGIAQAHCRAVSEVDDLEITAISDIVRERAEKTAAQFNILYLILFVLTIAVLCCKIA